MLATRLLPGCLRPAVHRTVISRISTSIARRSTPCAQQGQRSLKSCTVRTFIQPRKISTDWQATWKRRQITGCRQQRFKDQRNEGEGRVLSKLVGNVWGSGSAWQKRWTDVQGARTFFTQTTFSSRRQARERLPLVRSSGQKKGYHRQSYNYRRFQTTQGFLRRWAQSPTFYYQVGGIALVVGVVYTYNLDTVPVSGRRRFNIISPQYEAEMGAQMYQQTLQQFGSKIMPTYSREHRMVQRVLNRLIPHSGLEGEQWEIHVINDDLKNAFVIPGGKVFVFRGILDICQGDDGLAAVLGHEISHNVAHHAAERMSQSVVGLVILTIGSFFIGADFGISRLLMQLAFELPGSRSQEQEADYIGLLMMAESCFDPSAAIGLWDRMEKAEKFAPPQFLSTHPSSHNRLEKIRGWLPEAEVKWQSGECQGTGSYMSSFKSVVDLPRW